MDIKNKWTQFWDMHSGGGCKEKCGMIYIEAPEDEAIKIFYGKFGHNPKRVSCTCCGEDYSITEDESIEHLTAYHRGCTWDEKKEKYLESESTERFHEKYLTLEEYKKQKDVLFIYKKDIDKDWLKLEVPEQGYVWQE